MGTTRRSIGVLAVTAVTAALLTPATAGHAAAAVTSLQLSPPTGRFPVGTTELYLNDTSRSDPWVPEQASRELMVTLWYPTNTRHGTTGEYLSAEESRLLVAGKHLDERIPGIDPAIFSTVRTYAVVDAPAAGAPHSLPLIVLSPGWTQPIATLTGLAEDLASHGYVVAGINHTYETYAITLPDGRIAGCAACALDNERPFFGRLYQSRAADVSFVIDQLTARKSAWRGGRLIDASRIGVSGHSAGGAAMIAAMVGDPRIDIGINIDGTTDTGGVSMIPDSGLSRPFVLLGSPEHVPGGRDAWWDSDWERLTGWKRWLTVSGTDHASFTDLGIFADQLGVDLGATVSGVRATEITRRYNRAVFDRHLRHQPQPLLDRESPSYPEIVVHS